MEVLTPSIMSLLYPDMGLHLEILFQLLRLLSKVHG